MPSIPQELRDLGVRPRKKWGQNFLTQPSTAKKILRWSSVSEGDHVLEIGPGLGALTLPLLEMGCHVTAVEKDRLLAARLKAIETSKKNFTVVEGDFLEIDINSLHPEKNQRWQVISNLPYSQTSPILSRLFSMKKQIQKMTLLLQDEMVSRLHADVNSGDYGRLTIWADLDWEIQAGPSLKATVFYPEPEVLSRLVGLKPRKKSLVPEKEKEEFLQFVGRLFQQRRKTLRKILKGLGLEPVKAEAILKKTSIDEKLRPQNLSIEKLYELYSASRTTL